MSRKAMWAKRRKRLARLKLRKAGRIGWLVMGNRRYTIYVDGNYPW